MAGLQKQSISLLSRYRIQQQVLLVLAVSVVICVMEVSTATQIPHSDYSVYMIVLKNRSESFILLNNNCSSVLDSLKRSEGNSDKEKTAIDFPSVLWFKEVNIGYIVKMNRYAVQLVSVNDHNV